MIPPAVVSLVRSARRLAVLTGAGISAESGVPTFRDALTGLWAQYRPEDLATPEAFQRDPRLVWEWYAWRRELVRGVEPNAGHRALARLEQHRRTTLPNSEFALITQNVDGLHQRAGSLEVIELHGRLGRTICSADRQLVDRWPESADLPPRCPACGAPLRPDVVWFGEALPRGPLIRAMEAARNCDAFLSIGTSGLVEPAASLPYEAVRRGAAVIEVNPAATPLSEHAAHVLRGPAGEVLPDLAAAVERP